MKAWKCKHIENRLDEFCRKTLSDHDRTRFETHLETCPKCQESVQVWNGFTNAMQNAPIENLQPMDERRMVIAAINERSTKRQLTIRPVIFRTALAVCAATAIVTLVFALKNNNIEEEHYYKQVPRSAPSQNIVATPAATTTHENTTNMEQSPITRTADGRRVVRVSAGTNLWIDERAVVRVESLSKQLARFYLDSGHVVAEINKPSPGFRFIVVTPSGEIEAKGTVFAANVSPTGQTRARVLRGIIELRNNTKFETGVSKTPPLLLRAGESGNIGEVTKETIDEKNLAQDEYLLTGYLRKTGTEITAPAPVEIAKSPLAETAILSGSNNPRSKRIAGAKTAKASQTLSDRTDDSEKAKEAATSAYDSEYIEALIALALNQRKSGQYPTAAETYRRLIREFPKSAAARNANVYLGQLELVELGSPKQALSHFERYLNQKPSGFLSEEAHLGRVRACSTLGRHNAVERASSVYLKNHPGGYAGAEVVRRRGDARRALGNCTGAIEDYRKLQKWWPMSPENKHAEVGLVGCSAGP